MGTTTKLFQISNPNAVIALRASVHTTIGTDMAMIFSSRSLVSPLDLKNPFASQRFNAGIDTIKILSQALSNRLYNTEFSFKLSPPNLSIKSKTNMEQDVSIGGLVSDKKTEFILLNAPKEKIINLVNASLPTHIHVERDTANAPVVNIKGESNVYFTAGYLDDHVTVDTRNPFDLTKATSIASDINIETNWGNDTVKIFHTNENDIVRISSGSGNDTIDATNAKGKTIIVASLGDDTVYGGANDDQINGQGNNDIIYGNDGDDILQGGSGLDIIHGGNGDDFIRGGSGRDWLFGGNGSDKIMGDDSHDLLVGNVVLGAKGADVLIGGDGYDSLYGFNGDVMTGGADRDTFGFMALAKGIEGIEHLPKGLIVTNETLAAAKIVTVTDFKAGEDRIDLSHMLQNYRRGVDDLSKFVKFQQSGKDTIIYLDTNGGANDFVKLAVLKNVDSSAFPSLSALENSRALITQLSENSSNPSGFDFNYEKVSPWSYEIFTGLADYVAENTMNGKAEDLSYDTAAGMDLFRVIATDENDVLRINLGDDNDGFFGQNARGKLIVEGGHGADAMYGGYNDDIINGGVSADVLYGGDGNDTLNGGGDNDVAIGGKGNDILIGESSTDRLYGGIGQDQLYGGTDNDTLYGSVHITDDGGDILYGDDGNDMLFLWDGDTATGGSGRDRFTLLRTDTELNDDFASPRMVDVNNDILNNMDSVRITDFKIGQDILDLSNILTDFDAVDDAIADFVKFTQSGTDTIIKVDLNGGADQFVEVIALSNTNANQFADLDALVSNGTLKL